MPRRPPPALLLLLLLLLLSLELPCRVDGRRRKGGGSSSDSPPPASPSHKRGRHAQQGTTESELYSIGTEQLNAGRLEDALASFRAAMDASPRGGAASTRINSAIALQWLGRHEEAAESLDGALAAAQITDAERLHALYNRAISLRALGRPAEAAESLRTCVAKKPGFADAQHDLCASLFEGRDPAGDVAARQTPAHRAYLEQAIRSCDAAIGLGRSAFDFHGGEGFSAAWETKGLILDVLQRRAEAVHATAAALDLSAQHQPLAVVERKLNQRAGDTPEAQGTLHKVFESAESDDVTVLSRRFSFTPVFVVRSTSVATVAMNAGLLEVVRAMAAADPYGSRISNVGGWQSDKDVNFLEQDAAAVATLHAHILRQVSSFLTELGLLLPGGKIGAEDEEVLEPWVTIREAWANVNGEGHSNYEHTHSTATFAGCYYVASGFGPKAARAEYTGLRLHSRAADSDLIPHVVGEEEASKQPQAPVEHWSTGALGAAGTLALWPGDVVHSVPKHGGKYQRISIAFNVGLTLRPRA